MGMTAAQIKLGEEYAIEALDLPFVRFKVTEQVTRRTTDKTKNTYGGFVIFDDNVTQPQKLVDVTVGQFLGRLAEHVQLVAKTQAAEAEKKRLAEAKKAKQRRIIDLLTAALGYDPVDHKKAKDDYRYEGGLPIREHFGAIEITSKDDVFDRMLAFLEPLVHVDEQEPADDAA